MSELKRLRAQIDVIDRRIVRLLNRRLSTVAKIGAWKATRKLASYSPSRSAEIQRNVQRANQGPHAPAQLAAIYQKIIAASVALQDKQGRQTVGAALRRDPNQPSRRKAAPPPKPIQKRKKK